MVTEGLGRWLEITRVSSTYTNVGFFNVHESQDTIDGMKASLTHLKQKLSSDPQYFKTVYEYTFNFALPQTGQRSLGTVAVEILVR